MGSNPVQVVLLFLISFISSALNLLAQGVAFLSVMRKLYRKKWYLAVHAWGKIGSNKQIKGKRSQPDLHWNQRHQDVKQSHLWLQTFSWVLYFEIFFWGVWNFLLFLKWIDYLSYLFHHRSSLFFGVWIFQLIASNPGRPDEKSKHFLCAMPHLPTLKRSVS